MLYGLLVTKIVNNLKNKINTGKIQKIYQLNDNELVFKIRAKHTNYNLINSIQANDFRLHLTNNKVTTLDEATNFCMLLRKHLEGGIIKDIKQYQCERVIVFEILKMNELKDVNTKYLIFELLGRHSNTILCDHDYKIIQTYKLIPLYASMSRIIHKKAIYEYIDTKGRINPYEQINNEDDYTINYQGFSKEISNEFIAYNNQGYQANDILNNYLNSTKIYLYNNFLTYLEPLTNEYQSFDDLDNAFDYLYQHQSSHQSINTIYKKELNEIKNGIKRNKRKQKKLELQYQANLNYQEYQKIGTLLYDNLYQFKKDEHYKQVELFDFEDNKDITIKLNDKISYIENAKNYLKKYHKQKKSFTYLDEQIKLAIDSSYLYQEAMNMVEYATLEDFQEMLELLDQKKLINLNHKRKKQKKEKNKELNYSCFKDELNNKYYVGKNALQNNLVTFKIAKDNDIWVHIKDISGAHVIIKGDHINEQVIEKAAHLALYYSNTKPNVNYEIQYTKVYNLSKLNNQLGQVKIKTYKSTMIANDGKITKELEQLK
ncbi:MAG: NFACT family protein [Bacilli bacterium]|jgi:predicted ribosome quality control (RQC) complex YloA/Tae2 family protein|nr:NFACT family protein [Bacilli bacterium]